MIKYILCGKEVKHDKEVRYINAIQLVKAYKLKLEECVFVDADENSEEFLYFKESFPSATILYPKE